MNLTVMRDAFAHHVWATVRLIDECVPLSDEDLARPIAGTYGGILDTMRHIVAADAGYLFAITGGRVSPIDESSMPLAQLRELMEGHGREWATALAEDRDPDEEVVRHRDDGTEGHAPLAIRLAQALHHGSDHRSQVCTGLTLLGHQPPEFDVWAYGELDGRVFDAPST